MAAAFQVGQHRTLSLEAEYPLQRTTHFSRLLELESKKMLLGVHWVVKRPERTAAGPKVGAVGPPE
jgi:hypothetical protein